MTGHFARLHNTLVLVITLISLLGEASVAKDQYVPLFNGEDLSGWITVGAPDAFTVKEKAIYTTGAGPYPSWLRTEKEYENFVLRFEYQTQGWYEGGVLFHAPQYGPASKLGFKLHLRHDTKAYGVRSPGAIYDTAAPLCVANLPSGQWNQCEVECNWPHLRITLNNRLIHDINMAQHQAFRYKLRKGFIGIQNIGCRSSFRNIQIQALPNKAQWTSLFASGMDGLHAEGSTEWAIEKNTLTGKNKNGFAFTKQQFKAPYELQVWVKTVVNGNGGVLFNYGNRGIEVQCFNAPDSTNPTGSLYGIAPAQRVVSHDEEWFLLQILNRGAQAFVMVNGEKVCETNRLKPPYEGSIAFQQHTPGATIQYRGARIRKSENGDQ
jgi:hypothetical protein